jgi:putative transposase
LPEEWLWELVPAEILAQRRLDKKAARGFFRKLLRGLQYVPRVIITDKPGSYSAAKQG